MIEELQWRFRLSKLVLFHSDIHLRQLRTHTGGRGAERVVLVVAAPAGQARPNARVLPLWKDTTLRHRANTSYGASVLVALPPFQGCS